MAYKLVRGAAFVIGAFLVWYFGKPWPQDNAPFLIGLLLVMWVCGGLFLVYVLDFVSDLAGWNKPAPEPWRYTGPVPELSANKQAQVRKIVKALTDAGIFAPAAPEPRFAFPGQADFGGKVTVDHGPIMPIVDKQLGVAGLLLTIDAMDDAIDFHRFPEIPSPPLVTDPLRPDRVPVEGAAQRQR